MPGTTRRDLEALLQGGLTMAMVNRSAVIVKPRQPYLEWCRKGGAEGVADAVFKSLHTEPHVYLLPEYVDPESRRQVLDEFWPELFDAMLEGWLREESLWPTGRTRAMFDEWFEIQMCSLVQDLCLDEPLELL